MAITIRKISCPDGDVSNSDNSYTTSVASGGSLSLPDVTISNSDSSYSATSPSVQDVSIPDENITLNGGAFITKPSKKDQDILLKDVSGTTITPVSLSGNTITILDAVVDTGWQRPAEWLTMPTPIVGEFYGLYLVFEGGNNTLTVRSDVNDSIFDFENNGTSLLSTGADQSYTYDYSTLGGAISVYTEDGSNRNYKQAIFKCTAQTTGQHFTRLGLNNGINNGGTTHFADMVFNYSGINCLMSISTKYNDYLRIINTIETAAYYSRFFWGFKNLLRVEQFTHPIDFYVQETSAFTSSTINDDLGDVRCGIDSFRSAKIKSINSVVSTSNRSFQSSEVEQIGDVTINAGTEVFFSSKVNIVGTINCTVSTCKRLFQGSTARKLIFSSFPSNPTNLGNNGGCFSSMRNLEELILPSLQLGFTIANSNMGAAALDAMFTSLGTANGAQTITITGNPGAATCTTSIATLKGFTIVI